MGINLTDALQESIDDYVLDNEHDPKEEDVEALLEDAIENVSESSEAIAEMKNFEVYCSVLKHAGALPATAVTKLLDSLGSGFQIELDSTDRDTKEDPHSAGAHKEALEAYAVLFHWFVSSAEKVKSASEQVGPSTPVKKKAKGGKATKGSKGAASRKNDERWSWVDQIPQMLGTLNGVLRRLQSVRVWSVPSEREAFVTCIMNPVYAIARDQNYMKVADIRKQVIKAICLAVKYQSHHNVAQTKIFNNIQFQEHLAEPLADCLTTLQKDFDYPQLAIDILYDIAKHTFPGEKENKEAKNFSKFLVRLSERDQFPKAVLKQISLLVDQLDSEAHYMRIAIIEVLFNLITYTLELGHKQEIEPDQAAAQVTDFLKSHILPRALDAHTFVRTRVLQVLARFCDIKDKRYFKLRLKITKLAVETLEDKSPTVRKAAVSLLIKLIETHPYNRHEGYLEREKWQEDYEKALDEYKALGLEGTTYTAEDLVEESSKQHKRRKNADDNMEVDEPTDVEDNENENDEDEDEDAMAIDEDGEPQPKKTKRRNKNLGPRPSVGDFKLAVINEQIALGKLDALEVERRMGVMRYTQEGLKFVDTLDMSSDIMLQLLGSVHKPEVLEAIDFFYAASVIRLKLAEPGLRQMVHLIWQNDSGTLTSEDGSVLKGIRQKLLEIYRRLCFNDEDDKLLPAKKIAKNLIELTFEADLAYLTSLEELVRIMMVEKEIPTSVIDWLWKIYTSRQPLHKVQRRGAIVLVSMMALADHSILYDRVDDLLKVGLGKLGSIDLTLARYTCVALQRLNGSVKKVKGSLEDKTVRFEMDHGIFQRMASFILHPCKSKEWFGVAEQIINTVYALGEHPDEFCNKIIKELSRRAFAPATQAPNPDGHTQDEDGDAHMSEGDKENEAEGEGDNASANASHSSASAPKEKGDMGDAFLLAQLLFVVGHVAIKQIVFIELAERELKRQRDLDSVEAQGDQASKDAEELDQVVGNAEDEIGEDMARIRESALLYGEQSLLRLFGPILIEICGHPKAFKNPTLRAAATLSLSKFLCVSSQFCQENHRLLFKLLEVSDSPSIRSNIAIALGDIAVSFSTIIDENSHELYRGLSDKDLVVKKNTLMVLTHLILNGMIKVKGQLGEMAKCLVDENERIRGLAELFFKELSTKENAIYNNLPDVISHLSSGPHDVEEEHFHNIMTHIFKYVEKDKQTENIVEKLCQRFHLTEDPRQWRDIAYCLSLLPYKSERSVKKLVEGLPHYRDKLHEEEVFEKFNQILTKARQNKGAGKPENELNEFQSILENCKDQGVEDNALEQRVQGKKAAAKKRAKKAAATTAPRTTRRRRQHEVAQGGADDDEQDDGLS